MSANPFWSFFRAFWKIPQTALGYLLVLTVILGLTMVGLSFKVYEHARRDSLRKSELARLNAENASLRALVRNSSSGSSVIQHSSPSHATTNASENLSREYLKLAERNRALQVQLESALARASTLRQELRSGDTRESELAVRLAESEARLSKIKNELDAEKETHAQDAVTIRTQQDRLRQIEEQLAATAGSVERDRRLLTADKDIRDLMGARNLRIIDVFDVDGKGKDRKAFGRVFFTEGKSLIFYAFDLQSAQPRVQDATYQAWGFEGSYRTAAQSLGIFYRDDKSANRWVLKFDDPDILTEIDSVFVTVEPPGGSKKPTGNRLLAAYLKASLNHP